MISGLCARKKIIESTAWPASQMKKAPGRACVCGSTASVPAPAPLRACCSSSAQPATVRTDPAGHGGASQRPSPVPAWRLCLWTRSGTALGLPDPGWASPGFCPPACWLAAACPQPEELGSRGVAFLRRCQRGGQGDARTALPENAADCTKRARGC